MMRLLCQFITQRVRVSAGEMSVSISKSEVLIVSSLHINHRSK
uniref:Uncharacterized protein n=1 Tax=Anguilla anguilla TaxID=7936 RepID=A0A0E9WHY2_ANGAN